MDSTQEGNQESGRIGILFNCSLVFLYSLPKGWRPTKDDCRIQT